MNKKYIILAILLPILLIILIVFKPISLNKNSKQNKEMGELSDAEGHFTDNLAEYTNTLSPEEEIETTLNPVIINNIYVLYDSIDVKYLATLVKYYEIVHRELYNDNEMHPWTVTIDENSIKNNEQFLFFDSYIEELDNMKIHVGYSFDTGGFELSYDDFKGITDNPDVTIKK